MKLYQRNGQWWVDLRNSSCTTSDRRIGPLSQLPTVVDVYPYKNGRVVRLNTGHAVYKSWSGEEQRLQNEATTAILTQEQCYYLNHACTQWQRKYATTQRIAIRCVEIFMQRLCYFLFAGYWSLSRTMLIAGAITIMVFTAMSSNPWAVVPFVFTLLLCAGIFVPTIASALCFNYPKQLSE